VSPSRSTAEGAREPPKEYLLVRLGNGLSKPTDDVGQQLNDKFKVGLVNQAILEKQVKSKIEAYEKKFLVKF
jgi:hypothetical protein